MSRRGMKGQLNMFDFFSSLDSAQPGEVEMVSLVPDFDEPEPVEEPEAEHELVEEPEVVEAPEPVEEVEVVEAAEPVAESETVMEKNVSVVETSQESSEKVAMSRIYELNGKRIEIAYINYNKVRITRGDEAPIIKEFASTKEAVDYYVEQMQELEADE